MIRHDDDDFAVLPKFNLQPTPPPFSFSLFVTLFILGPTEERERERERERETEMHSWMNSLPIHRTALSIRETSLLADEVFVCLFRGCRLCVLFLVIA